MLKSLAHVGVKSPIYFIHAVRNSSQHAMAREVRQIAAECPNVQVHFRYDAPLEDDTASARCHSTGFVDLDLLKELLPDNNAEFYFCGPKPFMAGLYRGLKDWKVDDAHIHFEFFGPRQDIVS